MHGAGVIGCLVLSLIWWRLWMCLEVIGPIPFLHWVIGADGEGAYDLTLYEMLIHLIVFYLSAVSAEAFAGRTGKDVSKRSV